MDAAIPSLWRPELLHPLTVHFPIALLITGALIFFLSLAPFFKDSKLRTLFEPVSKVMIVIGALTAWIAYYTGGVAEDVVNRVICDPTVTHVHEDLGFWASIVFSAAAVLMILKLHRILIAATLAGGVYLMIQTAHLGASLVYQQGAGVYHPSPSCKEFE